MEIHPDKELDCRGMNCPMPVVNTKMAINQMQVGEVSRMVATDIGSKATSPPGPRKPATNFWNSGKKMENTFSTSKKPNRPHSCIQKTNLF